MDFKSSLLKGTSLLLILSLVSACQPSDDGPSEAEIQAKVEEKRQAMKIELDEVSPDGCLNLEKYFAMIRAQDRDTLARKYTSKFQVRTTGNSLTRNFYLRAARGAFVMSDGYLADLPDFPPMAQTECKALAFVGEGHKNEYKIPKTKKEKTSITFEKGVKNFKSLVTVKWVSPTSLEVSTTSPVIDDRCSKGARADITIVENISWGDPAMMTESLTEKAIDPNFLALVTEATGFQLNSLYSDLSAPALSEDPTVTPPSEPVIVPPPPVQPEPPVVTPEEPVVNANIEPVNVSDRRLMVPQLKELAKSNIRAGLEQCY